MPSSARRLRPAESVPPVLAVALFVPLFVFRRIGPLDFWWWMAANVVILTVSGAALDGGYLTALRRDLSENILRKIGLGILSAGLLYGIFFIGGHAMRVLSPSGGTDIARIYGFKSGLSPLRIVLLMVFLIGPGEELFWRAYLQRLWMERFGRFKGPLAAVALYTLVHIAGGNPVLVLAAAVCGLFWGVLYLRSQSALLVAVSHTVWDAAIFVLLPLA